MLSVGVAGAGEAMGQDAAFEVTAEFPLHVGRRRAPRFVLRPFEPGSQMRLYRAVEDGAFGLAAFPELTSARLPHYPFRSLLSVYSLYDLHVRQVPLRTLYTRGFSRFVTSTKPGAIHCYRSERKLPDGTRTR